MVTSHQARPQVELVVEDQVVPHVDDLVEGAVGVHHRPLEHHPAAVAPLDEQEADGAVGELRLVPDVQPLSAGHGADAARPVALGVPPLDLVVSPSTVTVPVTYPDWKRWANDVVSPEGL